MTRPENAQKLHLVPISNEVAKDCIQRWHRHNGTTYFGDFLRVGCATDEGILVAVGVAGRPTARHLADGQTLEVWRVASDGTFNSTSMLYGALSKAGFALGYTRIITYTQAEESGASLRAVGWRIVAHDARYMTSARTLWEA